MFARKNQIKQNKSKTSNFKISVKNTSGPASGTYIHEENTACIRATGLHNNTDLDKNKTNEIADQFCRQHNVYVFSFRKTSKKETNDPTLEPHARKNTGPFNMYCHLSTLSGLMGPAYRQNQKLFYCVDPGLMRNVSACNLKKNRSQH